MSKQKLILLVGPPCSGKSEWATDYIFKNPKVVKFSRDDIKIMLKGIPSVRAVEEHIITLMINTGVKEAIELGRDVIIDQSNCRLKYLQKFIKSFSDIADIKIKVFVEDLKELKKRNQLRSIETKMPPIPDKAIDRIYNRQMTLLKSDEFKEFENAGYIFFS